MSKYEEKELEDLKEDVKDESSKKPPKHLIILRLLGRMLHIIASSIGTGFLWFLCGIFIVTLGASSSAAYHTMRRTVLRNRGHVISIFFESFKEHLLLTLPLQLLFSLAMFFLGYTGYQLFLYGTTFTKALSIVLAVVFSIIFGVLIYLYPCMQKFEQTRWEHLKLAFYMTFRHLLTTLCFILVGYSMVVIAFVHPWMAPFLPGFWWIFCSVSLEPILRSYEKDEEDELEDEEDEEGEEEKEEEEKEEEEKEEEEEVEEVEEVEDYQEDFSKYRRAEDKYVRKVKKRRLKRFWIRKPKQSDDNDSEDDSIDALPQGRISPEEVEEAFLDEEELRRRELRDRIIDKHLQ